jgi:hypothetical protein
VIVDGFVPYLSIHRGYLYHISHNRQHFVVNNLCCISGLFSVAELIYPWTPKAFVDCGSQYPVPSKETGSPHISVPWACVI